jgi:protocatechuate 3,4-dioxygenase beta subunit
MTLLRITLSIFLVALIALSLYLWIALPLLQDPQSGEKSKLSEISNKQYKTSAGESADTSVTAGADSTALIASRPTAGAGSRLIEVFGRITDSIGQPVEDVLITEERYFFTATSDSSGQYRILLDLPRNRLPTLNFLRTGFAGKRIKLTRTQLQDMPIFELDTTLADSADTLRLSGWVANDIGVALEGVRIEIRALQSTAQDNYYLTVFSDTRGNFVLEGVPAMTHYRLTATLAPEYPIYSDDDFYVGSDPNQLQIELKLLKFVNLGGMILNPESAPVANFEIYISNLTTGAHSRKIVSDSSGFFMLERFPLGEVSLSTRGTEFFKISGLELTDLNYANLVLIVDRGDRYLSGWVSDENGIAVEKAMVTLDAMISRDGVEFSSYRSQSTDSNGRFSFENIARGDHRISVYANGFNKLESAHSLPEQSDQLQITLTRP